MMSKLSEWAVKYQVPHRTISSLLEILRNDYPSLPKDPRTLLLTPQSYAVKNITGGQYFHFGISSSLSYQLSDRMEFNIPGKQVKFQVNIDGLPVFKSTSMQFWPILGRVIHPFLGQPFIIGLFYGASKPPKLGEYLNEFVEEMKGLERDGLDLNGLKIEVSISCFICDTPARAFVKGVKGHNGYSGCDKCLQNGKWLNKMTFPETKAPLRTDLQFDEMADEEHHLFRSPLNQLSIGMVTQFPLDYMHLVCLGVMKKLLFLWMKGPVSVGCRIGATAINKLSDKLTLYSKYIPREFCRKGRSLREIDRWKATEYRLFLLYTGPVALNDILCNAVYLNFLLLLSVLPV
ncbi:uncharacterized protein LOC124263771 [Haliotis rubra]|uniref:uncharacterized protein LOC124263771 n=1 Tax=Haliotis rubra TaxID=36100 RepID=UPI001EE57814|nr:uncharacterized protein LOC124263771 [Haliotis rubra]